MQSNIVKSNSVTNFLKTALVPAHRTMYIWGGGWRESGDLFRRGLNPKWEEFYRLQNAGYDFNEHRFEREHGLDCSGYVGWVMYNFLESDADYVTFAKNQAAMFTEMGLGEYLPKAKCFEPGDIVSGNDHVYIAVKQCRDGSVILLHSSPPGVQLCAADNRGGDSQAACLVKCYTEKYYPEWYKKFGFCSRGAVYMRDVSVFRWNKSITPDTDCLKKMSPERVLYKLFE